MTTSMERPTATTAFQVPNLATVDAHIAAEFVDGAAEPQACVAQLGLGGGRCLVGAGQYQRADTRSAGLAQGKRRGVQRCAAGHHVIHQQQAAALHPRRARRLHSKSAAHIAQPSFAVQQTLWCGVADAQQRVRIGFGRRQAARDLQRLVEAAFAQPLYR